MDSTRYNAYLNIRGNLALKGNQLLPGIVDAQGNPYALHYGLPELNNQFQAGRLAVILNTGNLAKPLTRTQFLQGQTAPSNLFSHPDQTEQAQAASVKPNGSGWGGRLMDTLDPSLVSSVDAISFAGPATFPQGKIVSSNAIPGGGMLALSGVNWWPSTQVSPSLTGIKNGLVQNGGSQLRQVVNRIFDDGLTLATDLQAAGSASLNTQFPSTGLGNQLRDIARMIKSRSAKGPGRQVFFCSLGGFDTHSSQSWNHWDLLSQLSAAMDAFDTAMQEINLAEQVVAFTQSEFGRTLQPSGTGTDHGWGGHHFVLGGSVVGGVYGTMPQYVLGGPDDANSRGVWIPTLSTDQYAATLGQWFGIDSQDLSLAFPNLQAFPAGNIGFMA